MIKHDRVRDVIVHQADMCQLLETGLEGVLSTMGEDGCHRLQPVSCVYHNGSVYVHSCTSCRKVERFARSEKDTLLLMDTGVAVLGRVCQVEDTLEKEDALWAFLCKAEAASAAFPTRSMSENGNSAGALARNMNRSRQVYRISIEHITGIAKQ